VSDRKSQWPLEAGHKRRSGSGGVTVTCAASPGSTGYLGKPNDLSCPNLETWQPNFPRRPEEAHQVNGGAPCEDYLVCLAGSLGAGGPEAWPGSRMLRKCGESLAGSNKDAAAGK